MPLYSTVSCLSVVLLQDTKTSRQLSSWKFSQTSKLYGNLLHSQPLYWYEKRKYSDISLCQCHFIHHRSQIEWSVVEPGPSSCEGQRLTAWAMTRPLSESYLLSNASRFPEEHCLFWKSPRLRLFVLLVTAICRWLWSIGGNLMAILIHTTLKHSVRTA